ncbi:MAG: PAS domain S-box protein [Pseudomonadota bacterium]
MGRKKEDVGLGGMLGGFLPADPGVDHNPLPQHLAADVCATDDHRRIEAHELTSQIQYRLIEEVFSWVRRYQELVENLREVVFKCDEDGVIIFLNRAWAEILGHPVKELLAQKISSFIFEEDQEGAVSLLTSQIKGRYERVSREVRFRRKDGRLVWLIMSLRSGETEGKVGSLYNIDERKRAEELLKRRERELEIKTVDLQEAVIALRVILKRREEDQKELEDRILFNMEQMVGPYLEKLKRSELDDQQKACLSILESNLNSVVSPFMKDTPSPDYSRFTPAEVQIVNFVKQGKSTKEIADMLFLSTRTIESYRDSIREKIGIKNKKVNLRTYLLSSSGA